MHQKPLLASIGAIDPANSSLITFDIENHVPHLPHQISFLIQVIIKGKTIHQTVIDEGDSTYVMFVSCRKSIHSNPLNQSLNYLEAFLWQRLLSIWYSLKFSYHIGRKYL